jgi:hypothetical protein
MVARFRATGVLDLNGSDRLTSHITAGADVANLLDNDHYEVFGGDLLGRRALGHVRTPGRRLRGPHSLPPSRRCHIGAHAL